MNFEMIEHQRMLMLQSKSKLNHTTLSKFTSKFTLDAKYGKLLQRMVEFYKPKHILELGLNTGIESNYLLSNSIIQDLPILSYNFQLTTNKLDKIKEHTNTEFANFYESMLFENYYTNELENQTYFDLCLIHGQPDADEFWNFYDKYKSKLHTHSMVIFTNIRLTNDHYINWQQITNLSEVTACIELFKMGIVFFRTEQQKQKFILRY
jgi:predicted O-methyltransferase YrrM